MFKDWCLSDRIAAASATMAFFGFLMVFWQIRITNSEIKRGQLNQRAQFLAQLHERAFSSGNYAKIFQKLEYSPIEITSDFHGSQEQRDLVELLSLIEFVAQLEQLGLIEFNDVNQIFGYYIIRVYRHPAVATYRQFLKEWAEQQHYPIGITFPAFERLATRIERTRTQTSQSGP